MSIDAKLPPRAKGGVSAISGRTSDGMVTMSFSTRKRRASSTERSIEGIRSCAVGCSSESDFITSAGVFAGSMRRAVSMNAAWSLSSWAWPRASRASSGSSTMSSYFSLARKFASPIA